MIEAHPYIAAFVISGSLVAAFLIGWIACGFKATAQDADESEHGGSIFKDVWDNPRNWGQR
jgi:hypothetical protein